MIKSLFLIFIPFLLFGQYAEQMYSNPSLTTDITDWAAWNTSPTREWVANPSIDAGSYHCINTNGGGAGMQGPAQLNVTTVIGSEYRNRGYLYGDGTYEITCFGYSVATGYIVGDIVSAASWTRVDMTMTAGATATTFGFSRNNHTDAADWNMDVADLRLQLDTLYTDPSMADETDDDSTKTLTEAFETRGSHSGGYFITLAGTYAESITIDSSFTKWEASGSATVTSVDFNSVTCTVDLANLIISTKLNDENVTYLNEYIYYGYKDYKKKLGYRGYK